MCLAAALAVAASALPGTIDLTNLPNYANQTIPNYITRNNTPPDNQISNAGATLGRVLFYDKRLSVNNTVSCASCHQQAHGFSDLATASQGVNGTTGRHAMRLSNVRFGNEPKMFWDERAATVEQQATQPIQDHAEMGFSGQNGDPSLADLIDRMEALSYYPPLFIAAFGDPTITEDRMQRAIAQFVRSIQSFDSKYDAGRSQAPNDGAPFPNFTASENRGKQLFLAPPVFNAQGLRTGGGAGCAGCHAPPEFDIDPNSRSNGVIGKIGGGQDLTNTRSPSLRNMLNPQGATNGAFMHDGSLASLQAVLNHYNAIPTPTSQAVRQAIDARLLPGGNPQRLQLTAQENTDILAFLATTTGSAVYTDAKWSNPFDANGNVTIVGTGQTGTNWSFF
ncbi:cytochrome-c peroxidase [bacterium]|nr:cytochrome-c peroxidase [bacterium]